MEDKVLYMEELTYYDKKIKELISSKSKNVVEKQNYLVFPPVGEPNLIYIDTENNSVYRWDGNEMKYFCIGKNYENIDVISGGSSK